MTVAIDGVGMTPFGRFQDQAQVHELVLQLRGDAGDRQVQGAQVGLAEIAGGYVNGDSASVAVHILGREPTP